MTSTIPIAGQGNTLLAITEFDIKFIALLKPYLQQMGGVYQVTTPVTTWFQLYSYCLKRNVNKVITTQVSLIGRLVDSTVDSSGKKQSITLDKYAGSYFEKDGIEIVVLAPLAQLVTVPYGKHLAARYVSKLSKPETWYKETEFSYSISTLATIQDEYDLFSTCFAIAVDVETIKDPLKMSCIGYTGIWFEQGKFHTHSIVLPLNDMLSVVWMRKFNSLPAPKITTNGKYDIAYMHMYRAPMHNWLWDTMTMQHCSFSEIPKSLDEQLSYYIRRSQYWKNEGKSVSTYDKLVYNCKDTWATANVFLAWMLEAPEYARQNYLQEFPLNYPCVLAEATGLRINFDRLDRVKKVKETLVEYTTEALRKEIGVPHFNTNSPVQCKALLAILGCKDLTSTDETNLTKAAFRHPINSRILNKIIDIRKARKVISTYLVREKGYKGRMLYSLNPHGTDTGRLASKEHHFWCGLQIQNIPRDADIKSIMEADPNFLIGEADYSQAESRGTGYISGDTKLIDNVESPKDFHSLNAAAFFGIPYEEIFRDDESIEILPNGEPKVLKRGTINKAIRDLAKRTNHGANYNMGAKVMLETMGEANVSKAKHLLQLPPLWPLLKVCDHLLSVFAKTYPAVKNDYQTWIIGTVTSTHMLISATGWTRYCFGIPSHSNKPALNSYVAHPPQNLNAMLLNKAFMRVFYEVWLPNQSNFKLCAQIHDSILFQYRIGHEYLADEVKRCMEFTTPVTDIKGIVRNMLVPVDVSIGMTSWSK